MAKAIATALLTIGMFLMALSVLPMAEAPLVRDVEAGACGVVECEMPDELARDGLARHSKHRL